MTKEKKTYNNNNNYNYNDNRSAHIKINFRGDIHFDHSS